MGKIGGIVLISVFALTGCASVSAAPEASPEQQTVEAVASAAGTSAKWVSKDGQPFDIAGVGFSQAAVPAFAAAVSGVPGYSKTSQEDLAVIGRDLCEHYAGGFTTEDLRTAGGDSLAVIGEAAKSTVCAKQ